jgi:heptosyltransferase-3
MKARLLVVHTGGVGDFICTFPALSALAETYSIDVAGIPERAALACAAGIAESAHDLERTGFASVFSEPDDRLRVFASRYDEALVWMADEDGAIRRNLEAAGIPRVRCFAGIPPGDWNEHAAHWYGRCAGTPIFLPYSSPFPKVVANVDVIIQPGSGSRSKNWPLTHFEELATRLECDGYRVTWCVGPAEEGWPSRPDVLPPMPLLELAGVLAGARLFVGNDSGISHLAAAAGCPTVAIFGPTDPDTWKPVGPRVHVVTGDTWPDVASVFEAATADTHSRWSAGAQISNRRLDST